MFGGARFLSSIATAAQFPADVGAEVAIAGRSNAGKSSAINAIAQHRGLARTSKTPGRTRLLNFFELAPMKRLVDLPGYGYANVPEAERRAWLPLIDVLRERASLRGWFVVIDARRGITAADLILLEWAAAAQRVHVLLSKADKLSRGEALAVQRRAALELADRASVQLFSAQEGTGVQDARDILTAWLRGPGGECKGSAAAR
jgi:GTP-binding protein